MNPAQLLYSNPQTQGSMPRRKRKITSSNKQRISESIDDSDNTSSSIRKLLTESGFHKKKRSLGAGNFNSQVTPGPSLSINSSKDWKLKKRKGSHSIQLSSKFKSSQMPYENLHHAEQILAAKVG